MRFHEFGSLSGGLGGNFNCFRLPGIGWRLSGWFSGRLESLRASLGTGTEAAAADA